MDNESLLLNDKAPCGINPTIIFLSVIEVGRYSVAEIGSSRASGIDLPSAAGITSAKDRHEIDWKQNVRFAQQAGKAGFEALVRVACWRGFEGASNS